METSGCEDVGIPALDNIQFAATCSALGVMQRRALLAELVGVPAHLLCSSPKEQAAYRMGQAQRRCERSARYRPALRASVTAALTARGLDPTISWRKQGASAKSNRHSAGARSDSDSRQHDRGGDGHGDGNGVASACPPSTPACATPALTVSQRRSDELSARPQLHTTSALTPEDAPTAGLSGARAPPPAGPTSSRPSTTRTRSCSPSSARTRQPPSKPQEADSDQAAVADGAAAISESSETASASSAHERQLLRRSGAPPIPWTGPDLTLNVAAWDRLAHAIQTTNAALSRSGEAPGGREGGAGGGFRGKLQRNDALELREETEIAVENLREAAAQLPAHRVVWHMEQAQQASGSRHGARGAALKACNEKAAPPAKADQGGLHGVMEQQLPLSALALLQANVILSRPPALACGTAAAAPGSGSKSHRGGDLTVTAAAAGAVAGLLQLRQLHHRRSALVLTQSLQRIKGWPLLPYPELAALTIALAELCPLYQMDGLQLGHGDSAFDRPCVMMLPDCVIDSDLPLLLVRRCAIELATHSRAKARRGQPPPRAVSLSGAPGAGGGGGLACVSGGEPHQQHASDPDSLEALVGAAARLHVEAVKDVRSRLEKDTAAAFHALPDSFRRVYVDVVGDIGAKKCGGAGGGDGKKQEAATVAVGAQVDDDLLLAVCVKLPQLLDSGRRSGSGGRAAMGRAVASSAHAPEEPCLQVGLEHGLALGLCPEPADGAAAGGRFEVARGIVDALTHQQPRRLVVRGAAALRSVVVAASAVGRIIQASRPHPGAASAPPCANEGPVLLRFELTPADRQELAKGNPNNSAATVAAAAAATVVAAAKATTAAVVAAAAVPAAAAAATTGVGVGNRVVELARRVMAALGRGDHTPASKGSTVAAGKGGTMAGKNSAATGKAGAATNKGSAGKGSAGKQGAAPGKHATAAAKDTAATVGKEGAATAGKERTEAGEGSAPAPGHKGAPEAGAGWRPEEHLGQLTVTVVPRGAHVGRRVRQMCRFARQAGRRLPPNGGSAMIEVPSGGFSSHGADNAECGASLELLKQQLHRTLGDCGCAWLHCPDREALQAAALLVAKVHHDLQQEQQDARPGCVGSAGASASARGRSASTATLSSPTWPGLEVLPCFDGACWDLRIREARDRILQDLAVAARTPRQDQAEGPAEPQPQAQAPLARGVKPAGGPGTGSSAAAQPGSSDGGVLEGGWDAVRRLALNRETCGLMGLLSPGGPVLLGRETCKSQAAAAAAHAGSGSGLANGSAGAAASGAGQGCSYLRGDVPEAVRLLVVRQRDLDCAEGLQAAE